MSAKSPEAIARKAQRKNEKNRREAAAKRAQMLPLYKITARRMMARLPADITKAQLREMLAQAVRNTGAM